MASPANEPNRSSWKPSPAPGTFWRSWTYLEWNEELLKYCFLAGDGANAVPVTRLAATPEELTLIVRDDSSDPEAVAAGLVEVIKQELPQGTSFSSYCLDYRLRHPENPWTPECGDPPHFFAMLWFTCLVAYGYPDPNEGFHARITYLLFGKHDQLTRLPEVWRHLQTWIHHQVHIGTPLRELVLPPDDTFRTVIGYSYFLAFPHQHDRQILAEILNDARLTGIEPPMSPTLRALEENRERFSPHFKQDLDNLIKAFLEKGRDPRDSAFWRAVRQEAQRPSIEHAPTKPLPLGEVTVFAGWDDDELLRPYLACTWDWAPPPGLVKVRLDFTAGKFTERVESNASSDLSSVLQNSLHAPRVFTGGAKRAVEQGILPLDNMTIDEFQLATGDDITGCELALVREDRVKPFVGIYGGTSEESAIPGWFEVAGCNIRALDELPESMPDATTLQHTTDSHRPRFVKGLRTLSGAYYRLNGYLPGVRAPDAKSVELLVGGRRLPCTRDQVETGSAGDWRLPPSLSLAQVGELHVEAEWTISIAGYEITRRGECRAALAAWSVSLDYRPVPSGNYWRETCAREMRRFDGPVAEVPTGISTQDLTRVADLLNFDATARFLGPGIGEMSLTARKDFPWLAVGPKNRPDFLVFVGDPREPILPDSGLSPEKSDRRHWRRAFTDARGIAYVARGRDYVPVSESESVEAIYRAYRSSASSQSLESGRYCPPTNLDDVLPVQSWGVTKVSDEAAVLGEVFSLLANNTSGMPLREVHHHVGRLSRTESRVLRQQVVRGWTESGVIDLLQRQDGRRTVVVARRPRFVVYRRGPSYFGTLLGLLARSLESELERMAERLGVDLSWRRPANGLQPFAARVSNTTWHHLQELSRQLGFNDLELLDWPDPSSLPDHLQVTGTLSQDEPPEMYKREAQWCTVQHVFRRAPGPSGDVVVDRRQHGHRAPIYVVLDRGDSVGWSYSRTWALLDAEERSKRPPFELTRDGILRARGLSPLHLPLPLARLCAVIGVGLPGPELETYRSEPVVKAYVYPFGPRLGQIVKEVIPTSWVAR